MVSSDIYLCSSVQADIEQRLLDGRVDLVQLGLDVDGLGEGGGDPKRSRVFVVVSRRTVIDSRFSTVVCAPACSRRDGLATQVDIGLRVGLKRASSIHCDALISLPESALTDHLGSLARDQSAALKGALRIALEIE